MAKLKQYVSPTGVAYYPHLRTPDTYQGKELGFTVQLKLNQEDTIKMQALLEKELQETERELGRGKRYNNPSIGSKEDANGDILFKFKTKTHFIDNEGNRIERTVPIFDAKGVPIKGDITYGSKIRVAFSPAPYYMSKTTNGLSLYLNAVQVIEMANAGSSSMGAFGFDIEEGYSETVYKAENKAAAAQIEDNDPQNDYEEDFEMAEELADF